MFRQINYDSMLALVLALAGLVVWGWVGWRPGLGRVIAWFFAGLFFLLALLAAVQIHSVTVL